MELAEAAADIVHPEVRAHISSLVSAVSHATSSRQGGSMEYH